MSILLLYVILLKGTVTAFAGLASLPVIRAALVVQYPVLTDQQLNEAVVITRSTPGPVGFYVVAVGYSVVGITGAIAGWAAMTTPAFLVIPLVHFVRRKLDNPRVKTILQTIVITSAGLLLAAVIPLAREALTDWLTGTIAVLTVVLLLTSEIDTLWIVLGSAAASLAASIAGLIHV
jgi:chromate transporter